MPLHTVTALFNLGILYQSGGSDLPASLAEAVQWWGRAAELGFPPAIYNLAVLHLEGKGVAKGAACSGRLSPPSYVSTQTWPRRVRCLSGPRR